MLAGLTHRVCPCANALIALSIGPKARSDIRFSETRKRGLLIRFGFTNKMEKKKGTMISLSSTYCCVFSLTYGVSYDIRLFAIWSS